MKKILVFENDPQYFEYTYLYKWLVKKNITEWDFACTVEWDLGDLIKCGFDLVNKYDTIATETYFAMPKISMKDNDEFEGGQIREMMYLLSAILPLRTTPLTVYYSQLLVSGKKINKKDVQNYFEGEKFIRFSSITNRVFSHDNFDLKVLNINYKK